MPVDLAQGVRAVFRQRSVRNRTGTMLDLCIKDLERSDVGVTLQLWAENAADHFDENLSYDRWGPGVPVPFDDNAEEVRVQTVDPRLAVEEHLGNIADHPRAVGLLAYSGEQAVGFLIATLRSISPVAEEDLVAWIEQLYVRPQWRRCGVATQLVDRAVVELRKGGAVSFRADVPPSWREGLAFWERRADWVYELRTYRAFD